MRNKKQASLAERRWMQRVADGGCIICDSPCQVHHLQCYAPRNNYGTIGLCPDHHTGKFSIHQQKREFQLIYGDDMELLAKQIARVFG